MMNGAIKAISLVHLDYKNKYDDRRLRSFCCARRGLKKASRRCNNCFHSLSFRDAWELECLGCRG